MILKSTSMCTLHVLSLAAFSIVLKAAGFAYLVPSTSIILVSLVAYLAASLFFSKGAAISIAQCSPTDKIQIVSGSVPWIGAGIGFMAGPRAFLEKTRKQKGDTFVRALHPHWICSRMVFYGKKESSFLQNCASSINDKDL